jgi:sulfite exporter TauE/SafE
LITLYIAALSVGLIHTVLGPDHYLPFVAMARAGRWSLRKTTWVTVLCGVGHVTGSVLVGLLGVLLGISVARLEAFEAARGDLAGWLLLGFGLALLVWGIVAAVRNRSHSHLHVHSNGTVHQHHHQHRAAHAHVHAAPAAERTVFGPWMLFLIFVFGPCEPLIPILMYPAAKGSLWHVAGVSVVFGLATVATMTGLVLAGYAGAPRLNWGLFERYGGALAGLVVTLCGAAVLIGF